MRLFSSLAALLFVFVLAGCGGGGASDSQSGIISLFEPDEMPLSTRSNPFIPTKNTYKITESPDYYVRFATTRDAVIRMRISIVGWSVKNPFEIYDAQSGTMLDVNNSDILPAGEYVMKISSDMTRRYGLFFTFCSPAFENIRIGDFPKSRYVEGDLDPNFKSFWRLVLHSPKCIALSGGAKMTIYDEDLEETGIKLSNSTECLQEGTYYTYLASTNWKYRRHFTLSVLDP